VLPSHDRASRPDGPAPAGVSSVARAAGRSGGEDAVEFRALYEDHFRFVWSSLRRLGVREADALDLTQKVFLIVHARTDSFEGRSQLRTWIFGICQRVASDYRRSAMIRREVVTDAAELDAHREAFETAGDGDAARQNAVLAEAILGKLPEAQRVVFVLFELDELSGEEIAELLAVPVGTVRSRLRLAREAVRREVKRLAAVSGEGPKATP
jgi:RNA polymerase sigma-70 factor (ECF subfamily)